MFRRFLLSGRLLRTRVPASRAFASFSPRDIPFPYLFANSSSSGPAREDNIASHARALAGMEEFKDIMSGMQLAYRALLATIQEQDMSSLRGMVERRLYRRFDQDLTKLREAGCTFEGMNKDAKVEAVLKDFGIIVGGEIDRDAEYQAGLVPSKLINLPFTVIYTNAPGPNVNIIFKLKADIYSTCKLNLKDDKGNPIVMNEGQEERHELCMEGIVRTVSVPKDFAQLFWLYKEVTARKALGFENATIVDIDGALKGNMHKDSPAI